MDEKDRAILKKAKKFIDGIKYSGLGCENLFINGKNISECSRDEVRRIHDTLLQVSRG